MAKKLLACALIVGFLGIAHSAQAGGLPPAPPQDLQATVLPVGVRLTWAPPSSDGGASVEQYGVYRDGALVGSTADLFFSDPAGTAQDVYLVTATNANGESAPGVSMAAAGTCFHIEMNAVPPAGAAPFSCAGMVIEVVTSTACSVFQPPCPLLSGVYIPMFGIQNGLPLRVPLHELP